MEKVKRESKCLVQKKLLATPEERAAPGLRRAHIARHRHFSAINERRFRSRKIEKDLLPQHRRPDRLISLETVAIERVVPVRLRINVFARRSVSPVVRLLQRPAVRHHIKNIGNWRQNIRRKFQDVVRIRIQPVAKLSIPSHHRPSVTGKWQPKFRLCRQPPARFPHPLWPPPHLPPHPSLPTQRNLSSRSLLVT